MPDTARESRTRASQARPPARVPALGGACVVTLSDWYRDRHLGRNPAARLGACRDLKDLLAALGFDVPRELYFPAPDQHAFRAEKTLFVPPAQEGAAGTSPDCEVRVCATKTCWLLVDRVEITPLNLTAAESLVVRPSLHCGTQREAIDFCGVVGHAHESPGEYTKPEHFLVPPTGCFVLTPYNLDEFSDAMVGIEVRGWLVPPEADP